MRNRNPERFEASLPLALQAALTRRASSRGINRTALVREILTLAVMSESEPESKAHPLAKITAQLDNLANTVARARRPEHDRRAGPNAVQAEPAVISSGRHFGVAAQDSYAPAW